MNHPHNTTDKELMTLLQQHFEDDQRAFEDIKKHQRKLEELMTINSDQISYFNKNMLEIKETLHKQNVDTLEHKELELKRWVRIEPIVLSHEDTLKLNELAKQKISKWIAPIKWTAGVTVAVSVLLGAILYIRYFILTLFFNR